MATTKKETEKTEEKAMTFAELQNSMQIAKVKGQNVGYKMRSAETIFDHFKSLNSGWMIELSDEILEIGGKLFVKSRASAYLMLNTDKVEAHSSDAYAELSEVPVLQLRNGKGEMKQMSEPQWTGAVGSYARKYALQGLFAIGEADVDELAGNIDNTVQPKHQQPMQTLPTLATNQQIELIEKGANKWSELSTDDKKQILDEEFKLVGLKENDWSSITAHQASSIINNLKNKIDEFNNQQELQEIANEVAVSDLNDEAGDHSND